MVTALGLLAGLLTTAAWLPQLRRTWRLGRADDVSWAYLVTFGVGIAGWTAYGIASSQVAVVVTNAATLALVLGLMRLKARPRCAVVVVAPVGTPLG